MLPKQLCINVLLNIILKRYFNEINCINFISSEDTYFFYEFNNQPALFYNINKSSEGLKNALYRFGCQGFIVSTNQPEEYFNKIELLIRFTFSTKFHSRQYLFLPLLQKDHSYLLQKHNDNLFQSDKITYVSNLILVNQDYELFTPKFVGYEDYDQPILIDKFQCYDQTFLNNANLYHDKISNQQGRPFRINAFDYKPYINLDPDTKTEHGIELMMVKEYARIHNMTSTIIYETQLWGLMFEENYTATGAKGSLLTDKVDIAIGSWYRLTNYSKFFDLSEWTVRIGVTFLVPGPKLAGGWFTPLFTFSTSLWGGFIVTYIIFTFSMFLYEYTYLKTINNLNGINIIQLWNKSFALSTVTLFVQQPLELFSSVKEVYMRNIRTSLLILMLFISAIYNAGFASIMTAPRYTDFIKTSDELDASGLKWGAIHIALIDGFKDLPRYKNVVKNVVITSNEEIYNRMHQQGFAMIADRVPHGLQVSTRVNASDIQYYRVLKDDLHFDLCILLLKRSSIFIPSIQARFLRMKESGLDYYWEMQALFEENYQAQEALQSKQDGNPFTNLKWKHVQGAFAVLWIGLLVAILTFILEKFTMRKNRKNLTS